MTLRVAIASGKGGTGKTTLAVNLAALVADYGNRVRLLDADVEEPNCHLFLHPENVATTEVTVPVPVVDEERCTACGTCADVCAFRAITLVGSSVLVFPELCHACGACVLLCPQSAIREKERSTGITRRGTVHRPGGAELSLVDGVLTAGEAKPVPLIRATMAAGNDEDADVVLVDAPPGTSCPVIEAVRGSDVVVLVTEPTPFGLSDLRLAVETVRALGPPAVVAVNRCGLGDARVHDYCAVEGLDIVLELPHDRRIAEASARGDLLIDVFPDVRRGLRAAWRRIILSVVDDARS